MRARCQAGQLKIEMLEPELIQKLIVIGKDDSAPEGDAAALLDSVGHFDQINRLHWQEWDLVTQSLPNEDLVALVKGLTLAELHHRWSGGSVSSVIWTFREIQRRGAEHSEALADWILSRTAPPYAPFGTHNHGASSLAEYRAATSVHAAAIADGLAAQESSERRARDEIQIRKQQKVRSAQDRRTPARALFLAKLRELSLDDQLKQLAYDQKYSVEFYPTRLADSVDATTTSLLDGETRIALLAKLKGRHRGPWRRVKRLLLNTFRESEWDRTTPWDRKRWF
jgi:hypothetical protein